MESKDRVRIALNIYKSEARQAYSKQRIENRGVDFAVRLKKKVEDIDQDKCKEICRILMS